MRRMGQLELNVKGVIWLVSVSLFSVHVFFP